MSSDIIITNGQNIAIQIPFTLDNNVTDYLITITSLITFKNLENEEVDISQNLYLNYKNSKITTVPFDLSGNDNTVNVYWGGSPYYGTASFQFTVTNQNTTDGFYNTTSNTGTISFNLEYEGSDGCDTGPGPVPPRVWTRATKDCPDIDGVGENMQPTSGGFNLSEKRKAVIFQYKNNNINMSSKQLYSRLARGIGRQRGSTFATQSDSYTNANTKNLQNVNVNTGPLLCPNSRVISAYTSQNNTPGPKMLITNYPNAPLYNYRVRRTYVGGNTKWPQYGPNTGQPRDPKLAGNSGSKPGYQSGNQ